MLTVLWVTPPCDCQEYLISTIAHSIIFLWEEMFEVRPSEKFPIMFLPESAIISRIDSHT